MKKISICLFLILTVTIALYGGNNRPFTSSAFFDLQQSGGTWDLDIFAAAGWTNKWLFLRIYNNFSFKNHFTFSDHHLSANFLYQYKNHTFFSGLFLGFRFFTMGYHWTKTIYGLDAGYRYSISKYLFLGLEFFYTAIEGSSLDEVKIRIMPGVRF